MRSTHAVPTQLRVPRCQSGIYSGSGARIPLLRRVGVGMETEVQGEFGELLRRFRLAASLSQEALADRAGLSVRAISDLERGARRTPRPETVTLLASALGLSPADRAALIAPVLRRRLAANAPSAAPRPEVAPAPATALPHPAPRADLVGREREIAAVLDLLRAGTRLVTLTGPGGVGKTRLAHQIAADFAPALREGSAFIDLAAVRDPALVAPAIARTLAPDIAGGLASREALLAYLRPRELLLVLDNFEQITSAGLLVADLAAQCPQLRIVVTTRTPLRVRGEQEFPVPPLALPQAARSRPIPANADPATINALASYAAVELFVIRARGIRPDFQLTPANAAAVAGICQRLDGLPLALELAAAQIRVLPPVSLLARLGQRLPLPQLGGRDLPDRHQTLRAAISWSYELLDGDARVLFRRVAVFAGGFTLEALDAICAHTGGTTLDTLVTLIEWNLVRVQEEPDGTARYRLLETIRTFAAEQLASDPEEATLRERHARYYLNLSAEAAPHLASPQQLDWLTRLDHDWDNLRAALGWAAGHHRLAPLADAADGLGMLYELRTSAEEGAEAFRAAVGALRQVGDGESWLLAKLLAWESVFARLLGELDEAERMLRRGLALLDTAEASGRDVRADRAFAHLRLGQLERARGSVGGQDDFERSIALYRELGRAWDAGVALWELGRLNYRLGRYEIAAGWQRESLALREACGDRRGVAQVLQSLSQIAAATGQFEDALHLAGRANDLLHEIGDAADRATGLRHLGQTLAWIGRPAEGRDLLEQSLALYESIGLRGELGFACYTLCIATIMLGEYERTERQARRAMAIDREIGSPANLIDDLWMLGMALMGQGRMGEAEATFREGIVVGRSVVGEGGVIWAQPLLAFVVWQRGDTPQAERHILEALQASLRQRDLLNALMAMPTAALILAGRGQAERAVELDTLIWRYPAIKHNRCAFDTWRVHLDAVAAKLPPEIAAAARERGQMLDLIATLLALPGELTASAIRA